METKNQSAVGMAFDNTLVELGLINGMSAFGLAHAIAKTRIELCPGSKKFEGIIEKKVPDCDVCCWEIGGNAADPDSRRLTDKQVLANLGELVGDRVDLKNPCLFLAHLFVIQQHYTSALNAMGSLNFIFTRIDNGAIHAASIRKNNLQKWRLSIEPFSETKVWLPGTRVFFPVAPKQK